MLFEQVIVHGRHGLVLLLAPLTLLVYTSEFPEPTASMEEEQCVFPSPRRDFHFLLLLQLSFLFTLITLHAPSILHSFPYIALWYFTRETLLIVFSGEWECNGILVTSTLLRAALEFAITQPSWSCHLKVFSLCFFGGLLFELWLLHSLLRFFTLSFCTLHFAPSAFHPFHPFHLHVRCGNTW